MSKFVEFQLPIITQEHESGFAMSRVTGDLTNPWPSIKGSDLSLLFQRSAQRHLIKEGIYDQIFRYLNNQPSSIGRVYVTVPASTKRFDEESHAIPFDIIYWTYAENDLFGFVPALDVANFATNLDELKKNLEETILLEFVRNKRLDSQHALISRQWYSKPQVDYHPIQFEFYSPSELAELRRHKEEKIVDKTARRIRYTQMESIGLEAYVEELRRNILGPYRHSVLIVGANGCGKTALIQEFFRLHRKEFKNTPWQTTAAQLLRILTEGGGWQFGLGQWVTELRQSADIMYVGNYAELFEVGQYAGNSVSIGDALRDALQRNEITLIGEVTEEQLEKIDLRSPGYSQLFHIIRFSERKTSEENHITNLAIQSLCQSHGVTIDNSAIQRIISLHRRYAPYSGYPGKTIRFFESLLLRASKEIRSISEADAISAFCDESGMPRFLVDTTMPFKQADARRFFEERIIGQQRAIDEVLNGLLTVKSGMARSGKPITSALFVGPTGVGKTQIAKTLAEYIFGNARRMVRFDMSEYSDPYSVTRLTAASEASLVTKVRQQPFAIVLLDEIEKADASFFDLLLQVLDEGRLTDDRGEVANFCSTIVIMTSNIGAQSFSANRIGFSQSDASSDVDTHFEEAVTQHFRPELFNRIDLVVPFSPLTKAEQAAVVKKEIEDIKRLPGITGRPITLSLSENIYSVLSQQIASSKYGARAIQRIISTSLAWPLAEVLAKYPQNSPLKITVHSDDGSLSITNDSVDHEHKDAQTLLEIADSAAQLRSDIQALENGGTWINLLSQLDRLESTKLKKKEQFWKNPELVSKYEGYRAICSRQDNLLEEVFNIEEQALESLQPGAAGKDSEDTRLLVDEFKAMLTPCRSTFKELLVSLDSMANPHHNKAFLFIYGVASDVTTVERIYGQWFKDIQLEFKVLHIHLQTGPVEDEIDDEGNTSKPLQDRDESEEESDDQLKYVFLPAPSPKKYHQWVGLAFQLESPSVGLYLTQETGIWQIQLDENTSALVSVDLHLGNREDYKIPEGIQRKKYYSSTKPKRKFKDGLYSDKRFSKGESAAISAHGSRMQTLRRHSLESTHLNRSFQVNQGTVS